MSRTLLLALLIACGGEEAAAPEAEAPTEQVAEEAKGPADLAKVAKAIAAAPDDEATLLEEHGFTKETYAQALYDVASDPAAAAEYAAAYGE